MTRTEFNGLLAELRDLMTKAEGIIKKLLDAVEVDHRFIKRKQGYEMVEGDLIPKWECRSITIIFGLIGILTDSLHRHIHNAKDEVDTLKDK
jgi:hypothetical protein